MSGGYTTVIGWTLRKPNGPISTQILADKYVLAGSQAGEDVPMRWSVSVFGSPEAAREAAVMGTVWLERQGMVLQESPVIYDFEGLPTLARFTGHNGESDVLLWIYRTLLLVGKPMDQSVGS